MHGHLNVKFICKFSVCACAEQTMELSKEAVSWARIWTYHMSPVPTCFLCWLGVDSKDPFCVYASV